MTTPSPTPAPTTPPTPPRPLPPARRSLAERLGPAGPLAVIAALCPVLGTFALFYAVANTGMGDWLRYNPGAGVLIYCAGFAVLGGLAFLPTYAQSALGGWAFGSIIGVPAAILGFLGGSAIGYVIARRASGDRVQRIIDEHPKWRAVRDALAGPAQGSPDPLPPRRRFVKTLAMVSLLRLPPNSPFAMTNLVMASVHVPWGPYLLGTLIGMTPRTSLAVVIGAGIHGTMNRDALESSAPPWALWAGIAVAALVVVVIGVHANRAIKRLAIPSTP